MDDQLDNDLKKRIGEVFDNYEDTSADEGWLLLREKFPEQRSKRRAFAWIWWGAAAAILLVFMGLALWIGSEQHQPVKLNVKNLHQKPVIKGNDSLASITRKAGNDINVNKPAPSQLPAQIAKSGGLPDNNSLSAGTARTTRIKRMAKAGYYPVNTGFKKDRNNTAYKRKNSLMDIPDKEVQPQLAVNKTLVTAPAGTDATASAMAKDKPAGNQQTDNQASTVLAKQKSPEKTINDLFKNDAYQKKPKQGQDEKTKRVQFGVYAATYFNYAKGSTNQVNVGAGFSSDIKINNNLKLVTGMSIAQNSLNYATSSTPVAPSASFPTNSLSYTALSTPVIKNRTANLVGLDIPLNLKYEFNPQKSDTYISAGFSSGTFVNESYTYNYNYPSLLSASLQQSPAQTSTQSFNNFYFAKTLNVAFGVGYPFGKNRLVIEPFLKYPLDGLGAQNIRFGAGGVNLKFNFRAAKK